MSTLQFGRNTRGYRRFSTAFHLAVCAACVVLTAAAFLDSAHRLQYFPFIFLAAALINMVNAYENYRQSGQRNRRLRYAASLLPAAGLLVMTAVSAVCAWR